MGIPLMLITPRESRGRNGPVESVVSESVEVRDGAWWMVEGTENLEGNPIFATSAAGWTVYGAGYSYDPDVNDGEGASFRSTRSGTGYIGAYRTGGNRYTVIEGLPYTLSVKLMHNLATNKTIRLDVGWYGATGASLGATFITTPVPQGDSFSRHSVSTIAAPVGAHRAEPRIYTTSGRDGEIHWLTGVQFEAKPYATPFTVGTRPDGTITAPITASPASVYIRHDGGSTVLTEPGAFGEHGLLALDDGALTVSTARETTVAAVIAYDHVLTEAEIARLDAMPTAELQRWNEHMPVFSGVHVSYKPEPIAVSRRTPLEPIAVSRRMNTE